MNKREKDRIEKAFAWVQRKLKTNYNLIIQQFIASEDQVLSVDSHLTVSRSVRDTADPPTFLIYFDYKNTKDRSFNTLKQDALHEMIHILNWAKRDIFETLLKHVRSSALKKELIRRFEDADESATYATERAIGPHIIVGYRKEE